MITRIREVRRAKGMTLADVAAACTPPTTAQTVGRLETGTRTVSVGWLNRIAKALGTTAKDLVELPETADLPVAAVIGHDGAHAPRHASVAAAPQPGAGMVAVQIDAGVGEYRSGDVLWCDRVAPEGFGRAAQSRRAAAATRRAVHFRAADRTRGGSAAGVAAGCGRAAASGQRSGLGGGGAAVGAGAVIGDRSGIRAKDGGFRHRRRNAAVHRRAGRAASAENRMAR